MSFKRGTTVLVLDILLWYIFDRSVLVRHETLNAKVTFLLHKQHKVGELINASGYKVSLKNISFLY